MSLPRRRKKRKKVVDGLERQTVLPAIGSTPTRLDAGSKEKQYTEEAGIVGASPTIESVVSRARRGFHNPYFDDVVLERGVEEYLQDFTEPLRATKVDDDDDDDGDLAFLDDGNKPIQGFVEVKPKRYTRLAQIKGRYILRNNVDVRDSLPRPANMNVLLWHSAARGGEISNCKLAILNGASKSWRNERYSSDNFTPMLIAAFNGHLDTFRYLVEECHTDVEKEETSTGMNAFTCAAKRGHKDILVYIEKNRPHTIVLEKKDRAGRTALMLANRSGHKVIVKYIIKLIKRQQRVDMGRESRYRDSKGSKYFYNLAVAYTLYS